MEFVEKAILDTTVGANANREDLSNTLTIQDGPSRPVTQNIGFRVARNTTHQWNEIGLNTAGRTNVAGGGATYAEGNLPPTNAKTPSRKSNKTCNVGRTAQVTDNEMAAFNGGGSLILADGEMERQIQNALDFEVALVTVEVLNQIEWMHVTGDSTVNTMEGGETDGLFKFITGGGYQVSTGGTSTTAVAMAESFLKAGGRGAALNFPSMVVDTLLVPPELVPDLNSYIAGGAGRPIVVDASGVNAGLVGGHSVNKYNTGYSACDVLVEPYLSPAYNTAITNCNILAFKKSSVRQADLIKLGAKPIAVTDTSIKRVVNAVFAQEHDNAKHTFAIPNVKSAIT